MMMTEGVMVGKVKGRDDDEQGVIDDERGGEGGVMTMSSGGGTVSAVPACVARARRSLRSLPADVASV
jgi:hypothetical protein